MMKTIKIIGLILTLSCIFNKPVIASSAKRSQKEIDDSNDKPVFRKQIVEDSEIKDLSTKLLTLDITDLQKSDQYKTVTSTLSTSQQITILPFNLLEQILERSGNFLLEQIIEMACNICISETNKDLNKIWKNLAPRGALAFYDLNYLRLDNIPIYALNFLIRRINSYLLDNENNQFEQIGKLEKTNVREIAFFGVFNTGRIENYTHISFSMIQKLNKNTKLQSLEFLYIVFDLENIQELGQNKNITSLSLNYNNITDKAAEILAQNTTLKSLNLEGNYIGNEGAEAFSKNTTLKHLNLKKNNEIDEARRTMLSQNTHIENLQI